ncbi:virulence factor SrfC family protein [Martelella alba]|nr:virulence factor SrfC family protein [Martelella alba]
MNESPSLPSQRFIGALDALSDWLIRHRQNIPALASEADRLSLQLRRARNQVRAWSDADLLPPAIGLFGQSQSGKNYLVSALAAGENGRLETVLGDARLDIAAQINPDNQPAGLVIRYCRQADATDPAMPVHITLLDEGAVVKILALAFSLRGQVGEPDDRALDALLAEMAPHRRTEPTGGMSGDQVTAIWDFLARHDRDRQRRLAFRYWPAAVDLAPFLSIDDRARLFAPLWGGSAELTTAYRQFAHARETVAAATPILAPRDILVDGNLLPAENFLNALAFADVNTTFDQAVNVLARGPDGPAQSVTLSLAELNLLAAELRLPITSAARGSLLARADLLDFPGIGDTSVAIPAPRQEEGFLRPYATSIRQAKSLLLLEDYADRRQCHLLLIATAAGDREEAKIIGRTLRHWIGQNRQACLPTDKQREPTLIWALTPFDQRIAQGQHFDETVQRAVGQPGQGWGTVLAMDERGLARMTRYLATRLDGGFRRDQSVERLRELGEFLRNSLFADWLGPSEGNDMAVKQRIADQLLKILQNRAGVHGELLERLLPERDALSRLYRQTRRVAARQGSGGSDFVTTSHNGFQNHLQNSAQKSPRRFDIGLAFDLFDTSAAASATRTGPLTGGPRHTDSAAAADEDAEFARLAYHQWIRQLRGLAENDALLARLGMDKPMTMLLTSEFITASLRLNLAGRLADRLGEGLVDDLPAGGKADRQIGRVVGVIGDFVAWLGMMDWDEAQRPDSLINPGHKIFAKPEPDPSGWGAGRRLTRLPPRAPNTAAVYIYDWLVGLREMILQNAGYQSGVSLTPAQRQPLQTLLAGLAPDAP